MNRDLIPFAILALTVLLSLLAGCATYGYQFTDADGSNVTVHDRCILSKRALDETASAYTWAGDGSGNWKIGQSLVDTNSTEAIPLIRDFFTAFFAAVGEALKLYTATLDPVPPPADVLALPLVSPITPNVPPYTFHP